MKWRFDDEQLQKEVQEGTILQQSFTVIFVVRNQQCTECQAEFRQGSWKSLVQVRQRVGHKRTFFVFGTADPQTWGTSRMSLDRNISRWYGFLFSGSRQGITFHLLSGKCRAGESQNEPQTHRD